MDSVDFMLCMEEQRKTREYISKQRARINEIERKLNQDEKKIFKRAYEEGIFRIKLGDLIAELKINLNRRRLVCGKPKIDDVALVDIVRCFDNNGTTKTSKDEINRNDKISLDVDVFVDGSSILSLEDIELKPYDKLANGAFVKEALKDNGKAKMLMFKNEDLLKNVIINFNPEASAIKDNADVREAVFAVIEQRAVKTHVNIK